MTQEQDNAPLAGTAVREGLSWSWNLDVEALLTALSEPAPWNRLPPPAARPAPPAATPGADPASPIRPSPIRPTDPADQPAEASPAEIDPADPIRPSLIPRR